VTAVLLAAVVLAISASAHAESNAKWGIGPESRNGASRAFFQYTATPGHLIQDAFTLANLGDDPLTFELYAADALNTPAGGAFALRTRVQPRHEVGLWILLPTNSVTVPPHKSARVPFALSVPFNATPGDHAGGIVAQHQSDAPAPSSGTTVRVRRGSGVRVYVRVPGPLHAGVAVRDIVTRRSVAAFGSGSGAIAYDVVNTGNTRLSGTARARAVDLFGRTVKRFDPVKFDALLPGNHAVYTHDWPALPRIGRFRIEVSVTANGARADASSVMWLLPWSLAALIGIALVAAIALYGRRRRRRHGRHTDLDPSSGPQPDRPLVTVT
jgi:hypothetical protein